MDTKKTNPKDAVGTAKAPLSCVPLPVLAEVGLAMLEGASKYGRHNWRDAGTRSSVYFDAAIRHLFAWWEGQDVDPDSGLSHVTKAIATLTVLRDAQMQGNVTDDRPPSRYAFDYGCLNQLAESILSQHAGKNPHHYTLADQNQRGPAVEEINIGVPEFLRARC